MATQKLPAIIIGLCDVTRNLAKSKAKSLVAAKWSRGPSEPALGCLGTAQALQAGASKSTWEGAGIPQVVLCHAPE